MLVGTQFALTLGAQTEAARSVNESANDMSANVEDLISTARKKTEGRIEGWSKESVSRRAQMAFDRRLEKRTDELTQALDEAARAFDDIKDLAYTAEVRNVAVMD